jgi:hypothetical protein
MSKYQILDTSKKIVVGEAVFLGKYVSYFLYKDIAFTKTVTMKNFMRTFNKRISKIN